MASRKRTRPENDLTVAVAVAYYGIARLLRTYRKARKSQFFAVLVVPSAGSSIIYERAADAFIENTKGAPSESFYNTEDVQFVKKEMDSDDVRRTVKKASRRAIILFDDEKLVTDEIKLAADIFCVIPPPPPVYFRAAVFNVLHSELTWPDALYLSRVSAGRLQLAFIGKRSVREALKRLRALPPEGVPAAVSRPTDGPTLHDLSGYGNAKDWGMELARDLEDWKNGTIPWKDVDRGILLSGPPGTGKTMFAKALGATCGVPVIVGSASIWQSAGYLNSMLTAMRASFAEAREKSPSILFVDEIDSFGKRDRPSDQNSDYNRQVVNAFLECLDGSDNRDGVVVVGATNHPDNVDLAIRRPGRLGRHIEIKLPDDDARQAILRHHAGIDLSGEYNRQFIRSTRGLSGDEIGQIARDAKRAARRELRDFVDSDIIAYLPKMKVLSEVQIQQSAIHEIGHAITAVLIFGATLDAVNVERLAFANTREQPIGFAAIKRWPDRRRTRSFFRDQIAFLLGGIAGEEVVLGAYSDSGTGDETTDLIRATNLATAMEGCFGMGETLAVEVWTDSGSLEKMRTLDPMLRKRVHTVLQEEFVRAKSVLENNRQLLIELSEQLISRGTLQGEQIEQKIRGSRGSAEQIGLAS